MSTTQASLFGAPRPEPEEAPDVAYTPVPTAAAALHVIHGTMLKGSLILEAHVGGGAWLQALVPYQDRVHPQHGTTNPRPVYVMDIDPAAPGLHMDFPWVKGRHVGSFLDRLPAGWPQPHWIVGNPPWSNAREHLEVALDLARDGVAWIMPAGLEHRTRWAESGLWDRAWPAEIFPLGRVSYSGPGRSGTGASMTDSTLYVFRRRATSIVPWMGPGFLRPLLRGRP